MPRGSGPPFLGHDVGFLTLGPKLDPLLDPTFLCCHIMLYNAVCIVCRRLKPMSRLTPSRDQRYATLDHDRQEYTIITIPRVISKHRRHLKGEKQMQVLADILGNAMYRSSIFIRNIRNIVSVHGFIFA